VNGLVDSESYVRYMLPNRDCYIRLRTFYDIADCLNLGIIDCLLSRQQIFRI
jgi:hypothetical protein